MSAKSRVLRFAGDGPKTFPELGVELHRGDTFTVAAGEAERYLRRPDIEDGRKRSAGPPGGSESGGGGDAGESS